MKEEKDDDDEDKEEEAAQREEGGKRKAGGESEKTVGKGKTEEGNSAGGVTRREVREREGQREKERIRIEKGREGV